MCTDCYVTLLPIKDLVYSLRAQQLHDLPLLTRLHMYCTHARSAYAPDKPRLLQHLACGHLTICTDMFRMCTDWYLTLLPIKDLVQPPGAQQPHDLPLLTRLHVCTLQARKTNNRENAHVQHTSTRHNLRECTDRYMRLLPLKHLVQPLGAQQLHHLPKWGHLAQF